MVGSRLKTIGSSFNIVGEDMALGLVDNPSLHIISTRHQGCPRRALATYITFHETDLCLRKSTEWGTEPCTPHEASSSRIGNPDLGYLAPWAPWNRQYLGARVGALLL